MQQKSRASLPLDFRRRPAVYPRHFNALNYYGGLFARSDKPKELAAVAKITAPQPLGTHQPVQRRVD
jgi:hypothetical protein